MRRWYLAVAVGAVLTGTSALAPPTGSASAARPTVVKRTAAGTGAEWVQGEILVKFRDGVAREDARRTHGFLGAGVKKRIPGLGVELVRLPAGQSVRGALAAYRADPLVEVAEPNYRRRYLDHLTPNDTAFAEQWAHRNTGQAHALADDFPGTVTVGTGTPNADASVTEAHDDSGQLGSASTVVAVLDSGVDVSHPDLAASLWVNPDDSTANGVDDDQNGKVDDLHGWNFEEGNADLADGERHGTHVAGIVAAARNNAVGVAGVCPGCRIMALKFGLDLAGELAGMAYAVSEGAHIVNASFGSFEWSKLERDAIQEMNEAGILLVAAAGNDSLDNDMALARDLDEDGLPDTFSPLFPASYDLPNIIAAAASNHNDEYGYSTKCFSNGMGTKGDPCAFTNWGRESVDVAAPGVDILSTVPVGTGPGASNFEAYDGTSMAAPFVSGVAGLVKSQAPGSTAVALKNAVMNSVDRPAGLQSMNSFVPGFPVAGSFTRTNGRVNANLALDGSTGNATPATDGNVGGAHAIRGAKNGSVRWPDDVNDVYRRRLDRGAYRIFLNGPYHKDIDLYVWRPGTTEIWQFELGCLGGPGECKLLRAQVGPTGDELIKRLRIKRKGVYYFHVSAYLFQGANYRLTIDRL